MQDYLRNGKQRKESGISYTTWEDILYGVPQGSILAPHLFIIFLWDLSLEDASHYFTNYTENTMWLRTNLTDITQKLLTWFASNQMETNHDVTCFW